RADGNVRSPRHELKMALAAAESWTADFMRAAQPYPLPEVPAGSVGPAEEMAQVWVAEMEPAAVGVVKGTLPEAEATQPAAPAPVATTGGYAYPPPYTRYEVPKVLYGEYPWITVGKVFFKQHGVPYVASASSVGNHAIWTAGHVAHAGDGKE